VVVVVSEETGSISYAYKGQFVRGITLEELRAFLTTVLVNPARSRNWVGWLRAWTTDRRKSAPPPTPAPSGSPAATHSGSGKLIKFFHHIFFDDFWLKLFSMALALLIWLVVSFASEKEKVKERVFAAVPVQVVSTASDVRSFQAIPERIEVTVRGRADY